MVPRHRKNARGRSIIEEVMDPVSQGVVEPLLPKQQRSARRWPVAWYGALAECQIWTCCFSLRRDIYFGFTAIHSPGIYPDGAPLVFAVCDQSPIVFACFKASVRTAYLACRWVMPPTACWALRHGAFSGNFQRPYRGDTMSIVDPVCRSLGGIGCCSKPQRTFSFRSARLDAQLAFGWLP